MLRYSTSSTNIQPKFEPIHPPTLPDYHVTKESQSVLDKSKRNNKSEKFNNRSKQLVVNRCYFGVEERKMKRTLIMFKD